MIKLNYKKMQIDDLTIYYAKYRKNRSIRITVEENGEVRLTCPYFVTEPEIYDFVKSKESWIRKAIKSIELKENLSDKPTLKAKEKRALKSLIDYYVYKYVKLMNAEVNDVKLRKMKSQWGNCHFQKKVLTFNTYLYFMSESFIEAIVVHEVAHLFVMNHNKKFYNLILKYLPDYKERMKEAKNVSLR